MSIAVACPHCETKLNVRDDMAGRRGKCPKCNKPIDIPTTGDAAEPKPRPAESKPAAPAASSLTPEQITATVNEALAALSAPAPGKSSTAAMICKITRGVHYFLPILFGGILAWHLLMNGSWATGAEGTPGVVPYYAILVAAIALTAMSVLSHIGPPRPSPAKGVPLERKNAPLLHDLLDDVCRRLEVPPTKCAAVWDARLLDDHGQLTLGASALGNLTVADVLGVIVRDLAVYRNPGRRAARSEYQRLGRLLGEREPGESSNLLSGLLSFIGTFGRPVTWPLMVMVRSFAEGELRQAEFDADAIACDLVGSRALLMTIQRRRLIDYAAEMTGADIAYQFQDKSLHANRVKMVLDNMQTLPEEVQQSILETQVDELRTTGYWPSWSERIAGIQKLASPGVLKCAAPARALVADFEGVCKEATWLDYSQRFGNAVKRRDLR